MYQTAQHCNSSSRAETLVSQICLVFNSACGNKLGNDEGRGVPHLQLDLPCLAWPVMSLHRQGVVDTASASNVAGQDWPSMRKQRAGVPWHSSRWPAHLHGQSMHLARKLGVCWADIGRSLCAPATSACCTAAALTQQQCTHLKRHGIAVPDVACCFRLHRGDNGAWQAKDRTAAVSAS